MDECSGRAMARNLNIRISILGRSPDNRYFSPMKTTTVEEGLTRIEREFDALKHEVLGLKPRAKSCLFLCVLQMIPIV